MKSLLSAAAALALCLGGVARAQLPTEDELREAAKSAGNGALDGAKTSATEVAKDPAAAKKNMGGAAKTVAVGGVKGAAGAVTTKKTVKTKTTTTTTTTPTPAPKRQGADSTSTTVRHAPPN